jgi:hypothetical protein
MMSKTFLFAAAASLSLVAAPAYAKNANVDNSERADMASQSAAGGGTANTKYCIVERYTGSRLPQKICKTEREWKHDGINIHELAR